MCKSPDDAFRVVVSVIWATTISQCLPIVNEMSNTGEKGNNGEKANTGEKGNHGE